MKPSFTVLLVVGTALVFAQSNQLLCNTCNFILNQGRHYFNNNITNETALLQNLHADCQSLYHFYGPQAVQWCHQMVQHNIDQIYADLHAGKDAWQTCFDLGYCNGTEPTTAAPSHPKNLKA